MEEGQIKIDLAEMVQGKTAEELEELAGAFYKEKKISLAVECYKEALRKQNNRDGQMRCILLMAGCSQEDIIFQHFPGVIKHLTADELKQIADIFVRRNAIPSAVAYLERAIRKYAEKDDQEGLERCVWLMISSCQMDDISQRFPEIIAKMTAQSLEKIAEFFYEHQAILSAFDFYERARQKYAEQGNQIGCDHCVNVMLETSRQKEIAAKLTAEIFEKLAGSLYERKSRRSALDCYQQAIRKYAEQNDQEGEARCKLAMDRCNQENKISQSVDTEGASKQFATLVLDATTAQQRVEQQESRKGSDRSFPCASQ